MTTTSPSPGQARPQGCAAARQCHPSGTGAHCSGLLQITRHGPLPAREDAAFADAGDPRSDSRACRSGHGATHPGEAA